VSGSPGRAALRPIRRASRSAVGVGADANPVMSSVSLMAARGK
jgi:hypothetical protein